MFCIVLRLLLMTVLKITLSHYCICVCGGSRGAGLTTFPTVKVASPLEAKFNLIKFNGHIKLNGHIQNDILCTGCKGIVLASEVVVMAGDIISMMIAVIKNQVSSCVIFDVRL